MMHKLSNGYSVETASVAGDRTEFTTRSPEGDVISTVELGREAARELVIGIRAASCLRRMA